MNTSDESVYEAIAAAHDDARWAYGTGFADPLAGVDEALPAGADPADLAAYCLMLGDDALVFSHRLQEWCSRAPELEDEVAVANIALDLLGQARRLLGRAAVAGKAADLGLGADEDALAFTREEREFRNVRLVEARNGDFAATIARLLVFSAWRLPLLSRLAGSADPVLAAVAAKGVPEVTYHRDYAARWLVRLGDGTPYSHERAQAGLDAVWPYVPELFAAHPIERRLAGVAVDPATLRPEYDAALDQVLAAATLTRPTVPALAGVRGQTGRDGVHTEALGYLLAELQSVARAHPGATW
jgi:ring-1,2-phenylacetyl-CoA epoxidase subunit PaaC